MTTRDEVLAMAREAKLITSLWLDDHPKDYLAAVEKLVALAFEAGRKAAEQDRVDAERYVALRDRLSPDLVYEILKSEPSAPRFDAAIDRARSAK